MINTNTLCFNKINYELIIKEFKVPGQYPLVSTWNHKSSCFSVYPFSSAFWQLNTHTIVAKSAAATTNPQAINRERN